MHPILPKKDMTEEDIKLQYITPAVTSKWSRGKITMETQITDGKINLRGNMVFREKPKRADYLLYLSANNPIAVIEAKDNNHTVSHGLQQAMEYARMLDLPFAFSSNGDGFAEHDFLTGTEREFGLDEFPTEAELIARFKQESGLSPAQETVIDQPYYSSQNTYPPRYYQRIAINRTMDAIARGQQRLLLVMESLNLLPEEPVVTQVYVASLGEEARGPAFGFCNELRLAGVRADMDHVGRSLKAQFKFAGKIDAPFVAIVGGDELANGQVKLRNMATREEELLPLDTAATAIAARLAE